MVSPNWMATRRKEASAPRVTMATWGVPHRACTLPKAAGSKWSTPAAKGRRETEVPNPPNCPMALAMTRSAISGVSHARPSVRAALWPASARPFISPIPPGGQDDQEGDGGGGIEDGGKGGGDPAGARQGAGGVVDLGAHESQRLQAAHGIGDGGPEADGVPVPGGSDVDGGGRTAPAKE